jgi:hypothetical protein
MTTAEALVGSVDDEDATTVTEYVRNGCKAYGGNDNRSGFGELLPE